MQTKITKLSLLIIFSLVTSYAEAQTGVAIGTGSPTPNAAAMLDVQSTSKGMLIPSMTTAQRTAITLTAAAQGLMVFDLNTNAFYYNTSSTTTPTWVQWSSPSGVISTPVSIANGGTNSSTALSGSSIIISNGTSIIQGAAGTTTTVLHGNAAGAPTYSAVNLATDITGTLSTSNGGTGLSSFTQGSILDASTSSTIGQITAVAAGSYLRSNGVLTAPIWSTVTLPNTASIGDLWYGSAANTISALTGSGTTGTILMNTSAGAPSWKTLTTLPPTSGILPIANGGTNSSTTPTAGGIVYGNTTGTAYAISLAGTAGQLLVSNGTGAPTWITPSYGTGSVTSVSSGNLSPLFTTTVTNPTTTPALSFTLSSANAYNIFGNNTAASAAPTFFSPSLASPLFRNQGTTTTVLHGNNAGNPSWTQIVNNDITNGTIDLTAKVTGVLPIANGGTNSTATPTAGGVVYGNATGTAYAISLAGTAGQLLISNGAGAPTWITPSYGTGSVTSVSSGNLSPLFTTTVTNPTTTPALSFTLSSAAAHTFFGNFTASAAVPSFSTPSLASADFANQGTTTTLLHGNGSGNPSWGAVGLTTDVTGILPIANGGTNSTATPTAGGVVYGNAAGTAYAVTSAGTSGQVLTSVGTGTPIWTTVSSLTSVQGATTIYGSSSLTLTTISSTFTTVPGMSTNITVPSNCTAYIATDGGIQTNASGASGYSTVDIRVFIDGVQQTNGSYRRVTAANITGTVPFVASWSLSFATTLSAGTHTVTVGAALTDGASCIIGGSNTVAGNNFLQPELTIITTTQ